MILILSQLSVIIRFNKKMYICLCNPFSDEDVKNHLQNIGDEKANYKDVYKACTDGKDFNCGTCACTIKEVVDKHNSVLTIKHLEKEMVKTIHHNHHAATTVKTL